VGGVDEDAVGSAGKLEMTLGFEDGRGLVVDDLVGTEDVGSIVDDDVSVEGEQVAYAGLAVGYKLDGDAAGWLRFGLGDGQHFLAGIVGELAIGVV
jgi:hypothetical protein